LLDILPRTLDKLPCMFGFYFNHACFCHDCVFPIAKILTFLPSGYTMPRGCSRSPTLTRETSHASACGRRPGQSW
jgi:hypothetical protein